MNAIQTLAISALPVIFAITLHEAAHGYAARHFGDPTAWQAGRISANPIQHVDLFGTLLVPALLYWSTNGAFLFGWAKPVPVDFSRLRNPKKDMFWVAAAGPLANLAMAFAWGVVAKMAEAAPITAYSLPLRVMSDVGMSINVVLMVLNLFPIPPLDGGRIAVSLLPPRASWNLAKVEPWGFPIVMLLLFSGVLSQILNPLVGLVRFLLATLFQFRY